MEFVLLAKVGMFIKGIVYTGYSIAGSYLVRTAITYVKDYREYVAMEKEVK